MSQILSGGMLLSKDLLRTGEELLHMSQESKRSLWEKYAEPSANLTQRQRRKLMLFRFRAFLWARLLGKQSSQHAGIRPHLGVLRHLMTKCIPRISISPIMMPERPVKQAWQLRGFFVYDPSGFIYNGMYHDWSPYHQHITAITSHSKQPLIALMHSDGQVSIGKIGDPDNFFRVIHSPKNEDERATAIAFHPSASIIAVAIKARVIVKKISPSLESELRFTVSFYESGYFYPKPKYSADNLNWYPTGTFLTAISERKLSMSFFLTPDTIEVIGGGFNGWTQNYAVLRSFREDILPILSCFSVDGKLVMTAYPHGKLMVRSAEHTVEEGLTLSCFKISDNVFTGKVANIVPHPYNPSVFAIEVSRGWSDFSVSIVSVDHDGSVTIIATIPDAKSPHFHEDWLLVSSGNRILLHHMNRCNIPCLVTEFHLQRNGTMHVEVDVFSVITAPNGKVMLYYAHDGKSNLCTAEITLS